MKEKEKKTLKSTQESNLWQTKQQLQVNKNNYNNNK